MSTLASLQQVLVLSGDTGYILLGAILLAAGIIFNHFFPNKYWTVLVAVGIVLIAIGIIILTFGAVGFVLPYALH